MATNRKDADLQKILSMPNSNPIYVHPNGDRGQSLNWEQRMALLELCKTSDPAMYEKLTKDRSGCTGFKPYKESRLLHFLAILSVVFLALTAVAGLIF